MSIKYHVEITYKLDNEVKVTQIEVMAKYMQLIKEIKEVADKDKILNDIGDKYHSEMVSHDFDVAFSNFVTPGTILKRNTNFEVNKLNIIKFLKEIPSGYSIDFINKKVSNNTYCIYHYENKTDYKTLSDLDNEIISVVKK